MFEFSNSLAQTRSTFNTDITTVSRTGDNYWKLMLFCALSEADDNFVSVPSAGDVITLKPQTYAQIVKGTLLKKCTSFFNNGANTVVYAVVYTDLVTAAWDATDLRAKYALHKTKAYWKSAIYATTEAILELDALVNAETVDKGLSQVVVGTNADEDLDNTSTTSLHYLLTHNKTSKAFMAYHYDADVDPILEQLGRSLKLVNVTNTPVGNKLQLLKDLMVDPSKEGTDPETEETTGVNFNATERAKLDAQNIGYYLSWTDKAEDGVGLAFDPDKSAIDLSNNNVCARWIVNYVNYVAQMEAARLLSADGTYLDNVTYKKILAMLNDIVSPFANLGRLQSLKITTKPFDKNVNVSGKQLVIPNAWSAIYTDDAGSFVVGSDLTIPL